MKDITFGITYFPVGSLNDLINITNLDENIDYDCIFIVARDDVYNIVGVAGINLKQDKYPRFKHIIIHPSKYKSRLGVELMNYMEAYLKRTNKEQYVSYVFNENKKMQKYAEKWGMKEYANNQKGKWYYKDLIKVKENEYEYA